MNKENNYIFSAKIPKNEARKGRIYYYLEVEGNNKKIRIPEKGDYKIIISDDLIPPEIAINSCEVIDKKIVKLVAEIKDNEKLLLVRIKYKPVPSRETWYKKEMENIGRNLYQVEVPINKEGLLYFIESIDVNYNAQIYPDFLKETPYIVIKGWE